MPWITHMLFMGLNDVFSCQQFDHLLRNCSVKCRLEKKLHRVCDVTHRRRSLRSARTGSTGDDVNHPRWKQ